MLKDTITFIGTLILNIQEVLKYFFLHNKIFFYENYIQYLRKIVWNCLPIVTLTVGASSVIYAIHLAPEMSLRGLSKYLGGLVALAMIRETVPVMGALALITQYCTGMTAQIGSMKVSEQIDALKLSNVNPVHYLLIPMLLACAIGFPILNLVGIVFGIFIGFLSSNLLIDIHSTLFLISIKSAIIPKDIALSLIKAFLFGIFVSLISYNCGILTKGGSKAVGNSTRLSVVINFAGVLIIDYIITALWL